jgi:hypothetical protein
MTTPFGKPHSQPHRAGERGAFRLSALLITALLWLGLALSAPAARGATVSGEFVQLLRDSYSDLRNTRNVGNMAMSDCNRQVLNDLLNGLQYAQGTETAKGALFDPAIKGMRALFTAAGGGPVLDIHDVTVLAYNSLTHEDGLKHFADGILQLAKAKGVKILIRGAGQAFKGLMRSIPEDKSLLSWQPYKDAFTTVLSRNFAGFVVGRTADITKDVLLSSGVKDLGEDVVIEMDLISADMLGAILQHEWLKMKKLFSGVEKISTSFSNGRCTARFDATWNRATGDLTGLVVTTCKCASGWPTVSFGGFWAKVQAVRTANGIELVPQMRNLELHGKCCGDREATVEVLIDEKEEAPPPRRPPPARERKAEAPKAPAVAAPAVRPAPKPDPYEQARKARQAAERARRAACEARIRQVLDLRDSLRRKVEKVESECEALLRQQERLRMRLAFYYDRQHEGLTPEEQRQFDRLNREQDEVFQAYKACRAEEKRLERELSPKIAFLNRLYSVLDAARARGEDCEASEAVHLREAARIGGEEGKLARDFRDEIGAPALLGLSAGRQIVASASRSVDEEINLGGEGGLLALPPGRALKASAARARKDTADAQAPGGGRDGAGKAPGDTEESLDTARASAEEDVYFDFGAYSLGKIRLERAADELRLIVAEPSLAPDWVWPAGTVLATLRAQGGFWQGMGLIAHDAECGGDIRSHVRVAFVPPGAPFEAEAMRLWFGIVQDQDHDCVYEPVEQFSGMPYTAMRVTAGRPAEPIEAAPSEAEPQPTQPDGSAEPAGAGEATGVAPTVTLEGPAECVAGRICAFTLTLSRDAGTAIEGISLFAIELEPSSGMRLSAGESETVRCVAESRARQLCRLMGEALQPAESASLPLTVRPPSGGVRGGKVALCARGIALAELSERSLARLVQDHLRALGLYEGKIDGLVGPKTRAAIAGFTSAHGLAAGTEFTDPAFLQALIGEAAPAVGESCATTKLRVPPRATAARRSPEPKPGADGASEEPAEKPARPPAKIPCPPNFEPGPFGNCQLKMPTIMAPIEPME